MARADGSGVDYYGILGCRADASPEDIRRAYRRLALECHPDRNPGNSQAEDRFKEVSVAYAVLADPDRRRAYDRARTTGTPYEPGRSRDDLLRDLFADPAARRVFEELARELQRMGLRVDRYDFERTLFGGRGVVTGQVFVVGPLTPLTALFRLGAAAVRGARAARAMRQPAAPAPGPRGLAGRAARWLLGRAIAPVRGPAGKGDVTLPLRLTRVEAEHGGRRGVTLRVDGRREEVLVTVPPGLQPGTRLRLRGKGRSIGGDRPGDVYLTVELVD